MFVGKVSYMLWDLLGAVFALFLSSISIINMHCIASFAS